MSQFYISFPNSLQNHKIMNSMDWHKDCHTNKASFMATTHPNNYVHWLLWPAAAVSGQISQWVFYLFPQWFAKTEQSFSQSWWGFCSSFGHPKSRICLSLEYMETNVLPQHCGSFAKHSSHSARIVPSRKTSFFWYLLGSVGIVISQHVPYSSLIRTEMSFWVLSLERSALSAQGTCETMSNKTGWAH